MNRNRMLVVAGCLAFLFLLNAVSLAADAEPRVGQAVSSVKLPSPMSGEDAKYLGLSKVAEFSLQDIKAPYVLVEQMNTA